MHGGAYLGQVQQGGVKKPSGASRLIHYTPYCHELSKEKGRQVESTDFSVDSAGGPLLECPS